MSLLRTPKFPPPTHPFIEAKYKSGPQIPTLIVMHSTVSSAAEGAAYAIAMMWHRNTSPKSSAHYVVDAAKTYQCVYDKVVAWHCGYNSNSIGVEMCDDPRNPFERWETKDHVKMFDRTVDIVADLALAYNIPVRYLSDEELAKWGRHKTVTNGGITTHAQMARVFKRSTHWDPGEWPSARFLTAVKNSVEDKMVKPLPNLKRPGAVEKAIAKTEKAIAKIDERLSKNPGPVQTDRLKKARVKLQKALDKLREIQPK